MSVLSANMIHISGQAPACFGIIMLISRGYLSSSVNKHYYATLFTVIQTVDLRKP